MTACPSGSLRATTRSREVRLAKSSVAYSALTLTLGLLIAACATENRPHAETRAFKELWGRYANLPDHRALAVAGRVDSNRWVASIVGGLPTTQAAEQKSLIECRKKKRTARMASKCRLFAIGARRISDEGNTALSTSSPQVPINLR